MSIYNFKVLLLQPSKLQRMFLFDRFASLSQISIIESNNKFVCKYYFLIKNCNYNLMINYTCKAPGLIFACIVPYMVKYVKYFEYYIYCLIQSLEV